MNTYGFAEQVIVIAGALSDTVTLVGDCAG
jgi:hypothetical protein